MKAIDLIKGLMQLGVSAKEIASNATSNGNIDWGKVAKGVWNDPKLQESAKSLLTALQADNVKPAIAELSAKQTKLLAGREVKALSHDELMQYSNLADARLLLATQQVSDAFDQDFTRWLLNEALPELVRIAPAILALL